MRGIALGAASFFVVFWVDVTAVQRIRFLKPLLWIVGIMLFIAGAVTCMRDPARLALPVPVRVAGGLLAALSSALLVYSLFMEIPFVSAYVGPGGPDSLVTTGTYALCRHPGVLWLSGLLIGLFFLGGCTLLLLAIPVWVGLDVAYVLAQDRVFFPRMFGRQYQSYRASVPLLIPTGKSLRACASTIFRRPAGPAGKK